jgi:hypothetical protein
MKTVVVARSGNLCAADHLVEMQAWLVDRDIVARELMALHVLNFRVVFRAAFDTPWEADQFTERFG